MDYIVCNKINAEISILDSLTKNKSDVHSFPFPFSVISINLESECMLQIYLSFLMGSTTNDLQCEVSMRIVLKS